MDNELVMRRVEEALARRGARGVPHCLAAQPISGSGVWQAWVAFGIVGGAKPTEATTMVFFDTTTGQLVDGPWECGPSCG